MGNPALPGPPPVATDSTNSRQHRAQLAQALNSLNKHVFEADGTIKQSIVDLTTTVNNTHEDFTAAVNAEATVRASADSTLATNISTVSTTVGSNSASITSLQSSVNGLNTQWGIELDSNGKIIGRVQLNGVGATSSFEVHANNFAIYDGSSTTPAFQISGGVAVLNVPLKTNSVGTSNIQSSAVATGNIQANAVTQSLQSLTSSIVSAASWQDIGSSTFTLAQDSTVVLTPVAGTRSGSGAETYTYRIVRNGSVLNPPGTSLNPAQGQSFTDFAPAGTYTYETQIEASTPGGAYTLFNYGHNITYFKR